MWIKLTKKDMEPVLVNLARVSHVLHRTGGGSTLNFAGGASEKDGVVKPKALAVTESVAEISKAMEADEAAPAQAGKRTARS
jgi:hypothetical protein